jgi:molecular chaperone DnaK
MFQLSRADFESMIAQQIGDIRDTILNTLEMAGGGTGGIDEVLMVGGSSRIPIFSSLLKEITGKEPIFSRNLDEDVAKGAAILAAKLRGDASPQSFIDLIPLPVDVASHGLGVSLLEGEKMVNRVIIPSGSRIPASGEIEAFTITDDQMQLQLELNEGDEVDIQFVRKLGESLGNFAKPRSVGHPIRISMSYDADQMIQVKAFDGKTGDFICEINLKHETLLSTSERDKARDFLKGLDFE